MNHNINKYFRQIKLIGEFVKQLEQAKSGFLFLMLLIVIVFGSAGIPSGIEPIPLRPEPLPFTPEEFYIAGIIDERNDKKSVAWLLPEGSLSSAGVNPVPVDLKGGGLNAIEHFVKQSLATNTSLRPVIIRLKECKVTEEPYDAKSVEGSVTVSMAFDLQQGEKTINLTDYEGSTRYVRSSSKHTIVEQALRQTLSSSLQYLNNWMNQEAKHNIKLAKGIKLSFTDYIHNSDDDTVFYEPGRPLNWNDFLAKPRANKFAASVFPNFGYKNNSEVVDGYLNLNITFRVFMLKNISWVRKDARDPYGLNHEQRHFDIVKLVVERFKQKIRNKGLSMEDYDGEIGFLYLESYREMNLLQEQYDSETSHGMNNGAQEKWNKKITEELKLLGVSSPSIPAP